MNPERFNLPNEPVVITDEGEAIKLLKQEGLFDQLQHEHSFSHGMTAIGEYDHATHWILIFRAAGMADEKENCLAVFLWPKSMWRRTVVRKQLIALGFSDEDWQKVYRYDDPPLN